MDINKTPEEHKQGPGFTNRGGMEPVYGGETRARPEGLRARGPRGRPPAGGERPHEVRSRG